MSRFGWFVSGVGLGAVVGVLYAPKAGVDSREELLANAKIAKGQSAALGRQAVDRASAYVQQGKEVATQYVEQGKTLANDHLAQASAAFSAGKKAYAEGAAQKQPSGSTFDAERTSPEPGV